MDNIRERVEGRCDIFLAGINLENDTSCMRGELYLVLFNVLLSSHNGKFNLVLHLSM